MNGLYALKPWYADRLSGLRHTLIRHRVSPHALTALGVGFGAAAGAVLWLHKPGPLAAIAVLILLGARLACANLDGGVARDAGRTSKFGSVLNELGDRLAEFAAIGGLAGAAPFAAVASAGLAGTLPSWVALAGAAAGSDRVQGGPIGKTERCLLLVVAAATGWASPVLYVIAGGSLLTAGIRVRTVQKKLGAS